jgi:hypothetical protein
MESVAAQHGRISVDEKAIAETTAKSSGSSQNGNVDISFSSKQTYTTKMDWRLIPILGCTYTILFLDRTNSESSVPLFRCDLPLTCRSRKCQD